MSPREPPATDDASVVRWDRQRWISVFSSHSPTIREVTESLGLGLSASSSTTNRGIPKFDNPDYRRLSSDVTRLSKELPKERDALLDFAADPHSLDGELEELLAVFGPAIWGRDSDRSCLLTPDPAKKTYARHLYYEDAEDKRILKTHLHRWIIIKACYYIRNMKLKRPSAANDYDTLADLDPDAEPPSPARPHPRPSPDGTSKSLTPPVDGDAAARPAAKKRKSSVYMSFSDGEDSRTPAKRQQYQSHTVPFQRKSPRKPLKAFSADSPVSENIPPGSMLAAQSRHNSLAAATAPASTPEAGRPLLTPLSSNDLNGTARSPSAAPPGNGFTAVNTGSFTAVNTAPPARETVPQNPPPQNILPSDPRNYASPYDSSPYGASAAQSVQNPPKGPPPNTSTAGAHSFQAINSPVTNGASARNSPTVQHTSQAPLPSQVQAQPLSRSNTPILHHNHRSSLAPQRSSRSNTPIAPAAQPAPAVQPITTHHHVQPAAAPRVHHVTVPPVPSVPNAVHYAHQPQPVLKSHMVEPTAAAQQVVNTVDLSLLQCEVLGSLMQYFFPKPSAPPDEAVLLHKMESLWHLNTPVFRKQIGPHYDLQTKVLHSWITERRKIAQLRQALTYAPGVPAVEMVDRLLAMNDLRVMRLKWKNMSSADGLSSEDLLCRTFAILTNTEGTEYLFKDGLDRLNEGVFEFLRSEDMRILMHKR